MFIYPNEEEQALLNNTKAKKEFTPLSEVKSSFKTKKEEHIVTLYNEGATARELVDKTGVSMGMIYTVLNNHKVPKRNANKALQTRIKHVLDSPELIKGIITDYQYMYLKDIFKKYDIHKNGLYYILDLYGIERKSSAKEEVLADEEREIIVE